MKEALERYIKKAGKDEKTGKEIVNEIIPNHRPLPLEKVSLVCDICGWQMPITKVKQSPILCPRGCNRAVQAIITGNLSSERYSNDAANTQILDKFTIKRIK